MEAGGTPQEGEIRTKRKMKSASQLEVLEKAYAVEQYPSESVRAELSVKLDLSDRQLQMWFCHRRLKDRKPTPTAGKRQRKDSAALVSGRGEEMAGADLGNEPLSGSGSGLGVDLQRAVPCCGNDMSAMRRYYEPAHPHHQSTVEARAIAFVEAQLGEPLREDGPILGMEFDPLPPDAFGASIGVATVGQQKQSGRPYDANIYEQSDAKPIKGASRTVHEYQFLPEKPTVRTDTYERAAPSYHYGSPTEGPHARTPLSTVSSFIHGNERAPTVYGFQSQMAGLNLLSQQGRASNLLPSASEEYGNVHRKNFTNITMDAQFSAHPIIQLDNPFIPFARRVSLDEDVLQLKRKNKNEEARIMREVEAHEKKIQKVLEKQDILRRRREEQIRKEMERLDRERRKEEERLLREKQREEERYLREQRRELERKEKFLQKESIRAEKMRQKEELRREKEAARLKAANERAIARKNAKESMELIEDECLELMELAASSKGLPSMLSLDFETLQNLESFRDMRSTFPPKLVQLKKPFGIQPWIDSEENIGNLLMVWRFLITFVDVLGLWPFTLDEFVQAFHDYDSRLLGEIHVSLLRSIIKDIEDAARTPSMGLGANQNCAANPGGGHPQIVEGAYAWGFDIKSWKCNLNSLTWPEILRQFAVSAGFGPQLKKGIEPAYLHDDNEGYDVKYIISNLRSGAAVENAFAIMQERGFSNPCKSRHRLTPGTVKFAAFHVLSLEGSKGLNILEVADRIQKSGLRDLTTSKTPEASIAAALSRDSRLFERTAPSTYCVRAPYRKNTTDAEAILSAARERIQIFKSGILDVEEADEAKRDEESEGDAAEDPEVDDLGTEINPEIGAQNSQEAKTVSGGTSLVNGKGSYEVREAPEGDLRNATQGMPSMHSEAFIKVKDTGCSLDDSVDAAGISNNVANLDLEDTDIHDSNPGEPWVQGLTEGEYSDLSVEERLNALVALIGVAIEGNSIRIVLEERLEAANALKKQMWAVAQLDKRRLKEDVIKMQYSPFIGNKTEQILTIPSSEDRQSPSLTVDEKNIEMTVKLSVPQERMVDPQNDQNYINSFPSVGNLQMQEYSVGPDNHPFQQPGFIADKSHKQLKSYIGHKAEEMYVYRSLPLGQDRRHNRYWQFIMSASRNDPGCGRIFVELHDGRWRLIDSEEGFDGLLASLDARGYRESHLQTMLQKTEILFKETVRRNILHSNQGRHMKDPAKIEAVEMPSGHDDSVGMDSPASSVCVADSDMSESSITFSIELGKNETEKTGALNRYQDLERWIWKECVGSSILCANKNGKKRCPQLVDICNSCRGIFYFEENHCHSCHRTFGKGDINFPQHVVLCKEKLKWNSDCSLRGSTSSPLRIRLLKVLLALTEVSVPLEALQPIWTDMNRKFWGRKLHSTSSAEDLLQVLASLESAIKMDYLSSNFETIGELLYSSNEKGSVTCNSSSPDGVAVLPWIPLTTAAVALRLMEFDTAISYTLQQKLETQKEKESGVFILPSRFAVMKSSQNEEISGTPHQVEDFKEGYWEYPGSGPSSCHGRGRGRTRGGRVPKKAIGLKGNPRKQSRVTTKERLGQVQVLKWKGRPRGRGGRKRGRRSIRGKKTTLNRIIKVGGERTSPKESVFYKSPRDLVEENYNEGETARLQVEVAENASGSGGSEYEEENGDASGDEFDRVLVDDYAGGFNGKSDNLLEGGNYNVDGDEDDVDEEVDDEGEEEDDGAQDAKGNFDVASYMNGEWDEEEHRADDGQQNMELGEGTRSSSSDYSD